ncbi:hypothetical protein RHGRI_009766 [Rhododendron griersonianum]|uniref:Uncharacterized protein n=1 Tax=Rhododendron griersonianum TaxID=479676 RepID=A0AAV6KG87_9ERIC|nr:hypothetical protein RHGRI_009766 [Rhododendron griersonianum]
MSDNNLNGTIPPCLTSSDDLRVLNLSRNSLHGSLPSTVSLNSQLIMIDLSQNQLRGPVPRLLANCQMLEILVLGNNQIEDTFPSWLGANPELQVLVLRLNKFHGSIGNHKTDVMFPKLRILDLSSNGFSGNLPSEYFENWKAMKMASGERLTYMHTIPKWADRWVGYWDHFDPEVSRMVCGDLWKEEENSEEAEKKGAKELSVKAVFVCFDVFYLSSKGLVLKSELLFGSRQVNGDFVLAWMNFFIAHRGTKIVPPILECSALRALDKSFSVDQAKAVHRERAVYLEGNNSIRLKTVHMMGILDCVVSLCHRCVKILGPRRRHCTCSSQGDETEFSSGVFWMVMLMGFGSGLIVGLVIGTTLTRRYHKWFVDTFGRRKKIQKQQKRNGRMN